MRKKRSKDKQVVDKFNKQREDVAAGSRLHQSVIPRTSAAGDDDDGAQGNGKEEEDLQVIN